LRQNPKYYKQYEYLVFKFIGDYHFLASQTEDAISAGKLAISKAVRTYDKTKGAQLITHVWYSIRKEMQNLRKSQYLTSACPKSRAKLPPEKIFTVDFLDDITEAPERTLDQVIKNEEADVLFTVTHKLNKCFSAKDTKIFVDYYYTGLSKSEISKKYKLDILNLSNKLNNMLTIVRKLYN